MRPYTSISKSGHDGLERPDIVVVDEKKNTVAIVDITVAFENRRKTQEIWSHIADYFKQKNYKTEVNAFIVGSLGGYFAENVGALIWLRIGKKYSVLMEKLMVSETIRWSRDICTSNTWLGYRQYVWNTLGLELVRVFSLLFYNITIN